MKECKDCGEIQDFTAFPKDRTTKDGYRPYCRECNRKKDRQRYHNNPDKYKAMHDDRAAEIRIELYCLKASIGCARCPETDPRALDFHHKDPTNKRDQVPTIWHRYGKTAALDEASKCEVLCANCHRKEHCGI